LGFLLSATRLAVFVEKALSKDLFWRRRQRESVTRNIACKSLDILTLLLHNMYVGDLNVYPRYLSKTALEKSRFFMNQKCVGAQSSSADPTSGPFHRITH